MAREATADAVIGDVFRRTVVIYATNKIEKKRRHARDLEAWRAKPRLTP